MTKMQKSFSLGRRGFLSTLGGLGMSSMAMSISAATKREAILDLGKFDFVNQDMCRSTSTKSVLHFDPKALPNELTIMRSRLLKLGFLDEIVDLYQKKTGQRIHLLNGDCDDGVATTKLGKAHLGDLCCPINSDSPASGLQWLQVAQDTKVVLVPTSNPISNISLKNLQRIATGEITNWKDLGGEDKKIAFIVYDHCPAYHEPTREELLRNGKTWSKHSMRAGIDAIHLINLIRFKTSIGVNSWVLAKPYVKDGLLKVVSVDNMHPGTRTLSSGQYPLSGPFNLVFARWQEPLMRPFFDFLYGEKAQAIIARNAIPISRVGAALKSNAPEYFDRPFKNRA